MKMKEGGWFATYPSAELFNYRVIYRQRTASMMLTDISIFGNCLAHVLIEI